jgi:peptidoglycan/LPS O-acetylase OafA/YrhL
MIQDNRRDGSLEAIRGIAALIVVCWHCALGFFPDITGTGPSSIIGRFWFGILNGPGAVVYFFVLSGFVLTMPYFQRRDGSIVMRAALKRVPRLAGPIFVCVLLSYLLAIAGAYSYQEAAAASGSLWLQRDAFGFSGMEPGFLFALRQAVFGALFAGEVGYDPPLWTMPIELYGSMLVFLLAAAIGAAERRRWLLAVLMVTLSLLFFFPLFSSYFRAFLVGMGLSYLLARRRIALPGWAAGILVIVSLGLAGYVPGRGDYASVAAMLPFKIKGMHVTIFAAAMLVLAVQTCKPLGAFLSRPLFRFLGAISFPLYLIHLPILLSAGSAVYLAVAAWESGIPPGLAASLVVVVVSVLAAMPLAVADKRWVSWLGRWVDALMRRIASIRWPAGSAVHRFRQRLLTP